MIVLFRNHSLRAYPGGLARYEQVEKDDALARPAKPCDACILMTRIHECTCSWKRRRDNTLHVVRSIVPNPAANITFAWRARPVTSPADSSVPIQPALRPPFFPLFQDQYSNMDTLYTQVVSSDSQGVVFLQAVSR